jgi:membrane protein implicated in regulation of membrane protease activity
MDDDGGGRFFLWVIGVSLAIGVGGMLLFLLIGAAWYAWGPFIALLVVAALLGVGSWIWERAHGGRPYDDEYDSSVTDG